MCWSACLRCTRSFLFSRASLAPKAIRSTPETMVVLPWRVRVALLAATLFAVIFLLVLAVAKSLS